MSFHSNERIYVRVTQQLLLLLLHPNETCQKLLDLLVLMKEYKILSTFSGFFS